MAKLYRIDSNIADTTKTSSCGIDGNEVDIAKNDSKLRAKSGKVNIITSIYTD